MLTLTGKVHTLSDGNLKLSKYLKEKKTGEKKDNGSKDHKWSRKKKIPKAGKAWTKKGNNKIYNWGKWHKARLIHEPSVMSGPNACKLRLAEDSGSNICLG